MAGINQMPYLENRIRKTARYLEYLEHLSGSKRAEPRELTDPDLLDEIYAELAQLRAAPDEQPAERMRGLLARRRKVQEFQVQSLARDLEARRKVPSVQVEQLLERAGRILEKK